MKYILILLLLSIVSAFAQPPPNAGQIVIPATGDRTTGREATFEWTHNDPQSVEFPIRFRMYKAAFNKPEVWTVVKDNFTEKTAKLTFEPGHWRIFCTAYIPLLPDMESGRSEIVEVKVWPTPPGNANRVAVQVSKDLKHWEDAAVVRIPWPSNEKMFVRATLSIGDDARRFDAAPYIQGPLLPEEIVIFPSLTSPFSVK